MVRASDVSPPGTASCIFPRYPSIIETKIQGNCVNKNARPCCSMIPRHPTVLLLPFRLLHRLLPPRPGVLLPSLMWYHLLGLHRTMTTKFHISSHLVPIQRRNRTSRMPLSLGKRFCLRRSIGSVSSTFTSGYPRYIRTISEQTRSG